MPCTFSLQRLLVVGATHRQGTTANRIGCCRAYAITCVITSLNAAYDVKNGILCVPDHTERFTHGATRVAPLGRVGAWKPRNPAETQNEVQASRRYLNQFPRNVHELTVLCASILVYLPLTWG